jgi:plastocyanin
MHNRHAFALATLVLAACWLPSAVAATLSGKLELGAGPRQEVDAGEAAEGLVYFLPKGEVAPPKPGRFTVDTHSKGFSPTTLVIPVGSIVEFPNRDTILHNVFSRTPGSTFDFGYYGAGQSRSHTFTKPGLVLVSCNVHHGMRANVVVLATPYYTRPKKDGSFSLDGLPDGAGTLVFWHPRTAAASVELVLPVRGAQNRTLTVTKPRIGHAHGARKPK